MPLAEVLPLQSPAVAPVLLLLYCLCRDPLLQYTSDDLAGMLSWDYPIDTQLCLMVSCCSANGGVAFPIAGFLVPC